MNIHCKICGMEMNGKIVGVSNAKTRVRKLLDENEKYRATIRKIAEVANQNTEFMPSDVYADQLAKIADLCKEVEG